MDSYERIRQLRDDYELALDEAQRLRERYHREVVKLHRSGMSLREIADGLGMSHQRVHQIVSPHEEGQRSRKGKVVAAGAITLLLTLALAGVLVSRNLTVRDRPNLRATPSPRAGVAALPAISFGCRVSPQPGSSFTTITIAAECQKQIEDILRGQKADVGLVALDPHTGRIIAVVSGGNGATSLRTLLGAS